MQNSLVAVIVMITAVGSVWGSPIRVAVKPAEPFVMRLADGSWGGPAVELFEHLAGELGVSYAYEEATLDELLAGVESGEFAVGVGAITVTAERERRIDFTHPYATEGLAIAVPAGGRRGFFATTLAILLNPAFLSGVGGLAVVLLGVGLVVWLVERKRNAAQFGGKALAGLGNGFWFSAVTMTTVGYGDKAPVTPAGRTVALVWMFASLIMISGFTGAIASAFTSSALAGGVRGPQDLDSARVGTVTGTASVERLAERGVSVTGFDTLEAALERLADGGLDAVVHDETILRFRVANGFADGVRVLDGTFSPQAYALALRPDGGDREQINLLLLEYVASEEWTRSVQRITSGG
jgi:polar amino acid transport system substrate-binding protein